MEECSFAPRLNRKVATKKDQGSDPRRVKTNGAPKNYGRVDLPEQNPSTSRANDPTEDMDDYDEIRDVDTFVADQERFLQQKMIK